MCQFVQNRFKASAVPSPWRCKINKNRAIKVNYLIMERTISCVQRAIRKKCGQVELGFAFTAHSVTGCTVVRNPVLCPASRTQNNEVIVIHPSPPNLLRYK
jgi:hypothetical protein